METIATDFKPFGMLGGMYAGQNAANAQAMNNQAMEKTALEQLVKQRDAAFAQDEMNNPEVRAMRLQGMIGKDQSAVAAGALAKATNESDIKAKIAENISKIPKAELEAQMSQHTSEFNALRMLDMAGESSGYQGLDFDQKLIQIGKSVNMPQQELQKFMQSPPQQRSAMLRSRLGKLEQILTLTPKVLQEMATENLKAENTFITEDMKQTEANKRNDADNAARSADRAAAREDRAAGREAVSERELSMHLTNLRGLQDATAKEIAKLETAKSTVSPNDFMGYKGPNGKSIDGATRTKMAEDVKRDLGEQLSALKEKRAEIVRAQEMIFQQSKYYKGSAGTSEAPPPKGPQLPPGVSIVGGAAPGQGQPAPTPVPQAAPKTFGDSWRDPKTGVVKDIPLPLIKKFLDGGLLGRGGVLQDK